MLNSKQESFRDIHAVNPKSPLSIASSFSNASEIASSFSNASEIFTTISGEFSALVLAGSMIQAESSDNLEILETKSSDNLEISEKGPNLNEETDSLTVSPLQSPGSDGATIETEETERKISAWENAKIAKINNRFKRDEVRTRRWEDKQVHNATSWMKKVERKLEEKRAKAVEKMKNDIEKTRKKTEERRKFEEERAKAVEKMENDIVEARRKAEERKSSAEAKRRTKVAKIHEIANFMRAMGRAPSKYSFWK